MCGRRVPPAREIDHHHRSCAFPTAIEPSIQFDIDGDGDALIASYSSNAQRIFNPYGLDNTSICHSIIIQIGSFTHTHTLTLETTIYKRRTYIISLNRISRNSAPPPASFANSRWRNRRRSWRVSVVGSRDGRPPNLGGRIGPRSNFASDPRRYDPAGRGHWTSTPAAVAEVVQSRSVWHCRRGKMFAVWTNGAMPASGHRFERRSSNANRYESVADRFSALVVDWRQQINEKWYKFQWKRTARMMMMISRHYTRKRHKYLMWRLRQVERHIDRDGDANRTNNQPIKLHPFLLIDSSVGQQWLDDL